MSLSEEMTELARRARLASHRLNSLSAGEKNNCLLAMADGIEGNSQFIQQENAKDRGGKEGSRWHGCSRWLGNEKTDERDGEKAGVSAKGERQRNA